MNEYEYFHEKETVELKSPTRLSRKSLHEFLMSSGFKSEDDFYYIDRIDKAEPWQSVSVMSIDVFFNDEPVYETEEDIKESGGGAWDRLNVSYLLASLPQSYINEFCDKVFLLADKFDLKIYHRSTEADRSKLSEIFNSYAKALTENYSAPGSEDLGVLIQDTYPR